MSAQPRPQSGLGIAAGILVIFGAALCLIARGSSGEGFVVTSGWGCMFATLGSVLAIGGLFAPERRRGVPAVALFLNAAVLAALLAAVPARDPLGRTYAMALGAGIVGVVVLAAMAATRRRSRRARDIAKELGLERHGAAYRGTRGGVPVEIVPDSFPTVRAYARQSAPYRFRFDAEHDGGDRGAELLRDEGFALELELWSETSRDAVLGCEGSRSAIAASRSVAQLDELPRVLDQAISLVKRASAAVSNTGPVSSVGSSVLLRAARLAEWPAFQRYFDVAITEPAPRVTLLLEQEKLFETRIDPSPEERSLAGKWLRLWFALSEGEGVTFNAELFDAEPFSGQRSSEGVRFAIFSLRTQDGDTARGLVPPGPGSRARLCGSCRSCGEPFTLVQPQEGPPKARVIHCETGLCSLLIRAEEPLDSSARCPRCNAAYSVSHALRCVGCAAPLIDFEARPELRDYDYFHGASSLRRSS